MPVIVDEVSEMYKSRYQGPKKLWFVRTFLSPRITGQWLCSLVWGETYVSLQRKTAMAQAFFWRLVCKVVTNNKTGRTNKISRTASKVVKIIHRTSYSSGVSGLSG